MNSELIVGIPLLTVVSEKSREQIITRYDEKTGEPYELTVAHSFFALGTNDYSFKGTLRDDIECLGDGLLATALRKHGLFIYGYDHGFQPDLRLAVIGFSVFKNCNISGNMNVQSINFRRLNEEFENCRRAFEEIGIVDEPQLFLITERRGG